MANKVLLTPTELSFSLNEELGGYIGFIASDFVLVEGKDYIVYWEGAEYTRTAFAFVFADGSELVAVGNPLVAGGEDNKDEFAIIYDPTNNYRYCASTVPATTHIVGLYQEVDYGTVVLEERTIQTVLDTNYGLYGNTTTDVMNLTLGATYTVLWDGEQYTCTAYDSSSVIDDSLYLGNASDFGFAGNNEPFIIVSIAEGTALFSLTDTTENTHDVAVYQSNVLLQENTYQFTEGDGGCFVEAQVDCDLMVVGETYTVCWDGVNYVGVAVDVDGESAIGDFSGSFSTYPFIIVTIDGGNDGTFLVMGTDSMEPTHTVAIYHGDVQNNSAVIIEEQEFTGFVKADESLNFYAYTSSVSKSVAMFTEGEIHTVCWDGNNYTCVAYHCEDGIIAIGATLEGNGNIDFSKYPFLILIASAELLKDETGILAIYTNSANESHTVAVYRGNLSGDGGSDTPEDTIPDGTAILEEQELEFAMVPDGSAYECVAEKNIDLFENGKTYTIAWDGVHYFCTAERLDSISHVGDEDDDYTTYPFSIYITPCFSGNTEKNQLIVATNSTESTHMVAIYKGVVERSEPNGIVIKDPLGRSITYGEYRKILVNRANGEKTIFSEGDAVYNVPIDLDFSHGNQEVSAPRGTLVKTAVIQKPEALVPENILKGVEIAGVAGTAVGNTEEVEVELNLAGGNQIVVPSSDDVAIAKATIVKPETLVPENIVSGIEIAGVVGEYSVDAEEKTVAADFSDGDMEIAPTEGKLLEKVFVTKPETLVPENIAAGVDVAGVVGTHQGGGGALMPCMFVKHKAQMAIRSSSLSYNVSISVTLPVTATILGVLGGSKGSSVSSSGSTGTYETGNYSGGDGYNVLSPTIDKSDTGITLTQTNRYGSASSQYRRAISSLIVLFTIQGIFLSYNGDGTYDIIADSTATELPDCNSIPMNKNNLRCVDLSNSNISSIPSYFQYSTTTQEIILPPTITNIGSYGLYSSSLTVLDMSRSTSVPTLSSYAIYKTAGLQILVPSALYDEWIVASNWSSYADYIVPV